jgi:ClpA/ClpB-like protein
MCPVSDGNHEGACQERLAIRTGRREGNRDEIAYTANSPHVRAEHLFLAIIHDKGMPAQVLACLADVSRLEAAVTEAAGRAAAQPDERPSRPEPAGFRVAAEMGGSYVGTWHLLLALIAGTRPAERTSVLTRPR